jgi:hypothetical protein
MKKYHITYQSMTAFYDMGHIYAPDKDTTLREARAKATAFSQGEKSLIRANEVKN